MSPDLVPQPFCALPMAEAAAVDGLFARWCSEHP